MIEAMIRGQSLWGQRLAGERELAAELRISRKTMRLALAELEADGLIVRRHGAGTFVADRSSQRRGKAAAHLAVIAEDHFEKTPGWAYSAELLRAVLHEAPRWRAKGTILSLNQPDEQRRIWDARAMREFSGFVVLQHDDRELLSHLLELKRGPVVLLDHYLRDLPIIGVVDGSFAGARAVTRYLLGLGHRRIAFIDCFNRAETNPEKFAGYRTALSERDIALNGDLVAVPGENFQGEALDRFVEGAVERLLRLPDPPTAIFGFDDSRALPAARFLEARGYTIGRDMSVAGFGDSAIRRGLCDWLTSCRIYTSRMGREAARAALQRSAPQECRTIIVPNRLMIRRSTCPPPTITRK